MTRIGEWLLDLSLNQITKGGEVVALEPLAAQVLDYFARHPNQVVNTDQLTEALWNRRLVGDNPVYRIIADLRRALRDDAREPRYIQTIRKRGYRLIANVEVDPVQRSVDPNSTPTHVPSLPSASLRFRPFFIVGAVIAALSAITIAWWPAQSVRSHDTGTGEYTFEELLRTGRTKLSNRDFVGAESLLKKAIETLKDSHKTNTAGYAAALTTMASLEFQRNNLTEAYALYDEALPLIRTLYGSKHLETVNTLILYSGAKRRGDDYTAAVALGKQAVDILQSYMPQLDPSRLRAEANYAGAILASGDVESAASLIERNFASYRQVFGDQSPQILEPLQSLARLRRAQGDLHAFEELTRKALRLSREVLGEDALGTGFSRAELGSILWERNQFPEAERELRASLEVYAKTLPADHLFVCSSEYILAETLLAQGNVAEAIPLLQSSRDRLKRVKATASRIARSEHALGYAMIMNGNFLEGAERMERSFRVLIENPGTGRHFMRLSFDRQERLYVRLDDQVKLAELLAHRDKLKFH